MRKSGYIPVLVFSFLVFSAFVSASEIELNAGDEINIPDSGTEISWSQTITYNATGINKEGRNLSFERSFTDSDILYSIFSNTSDQINVSITNQDFSGDMISGERIFEFDASAVQDSEVSFNFGGAPSRLSRKYDLFADDVRFDQQDSRDLIQWNFTDWSTHTFEFENNETDLEVGNITFNNSNPVEGEIVRITANVTNYDSKDLTSVFNFTERDYNGTEYVFKSNKTREVTVENQSAKLVNFTFDAPIGSFNYTITADDEDEINETVESNNQNSSLLNVSSYQIFYGGSDVTYQLGDQRGLRKWQKAMPTGSLYYADEEASYELQNLTALNGTDDLQEATESLNLGGHSDSIKNIYDEDGDGESDNTTCFTIAASEVCDIPVTNSTNSSNFITGILYDETDGSGFDGSQDLVFTTKVYENSRQGMYGDYNYEIKVPSTLSDQVMEGEYIRYRLEIK